MIDSQAVKNTCNASNASKGFCHYKVTNGIKRHLAVDTLGFPFFTHCTKANISDDQGLPFDALGQYRLLQVQTCEYSKDYDFGRPRVSSREHPKGTWEGLSPSDD